MPGDWNRIVAVTVMVDAGSKHDPGKLHGLASLTNSMLIQGTTGRSGPELAELTDSAGISMGYETTRDYAMIYVTAIDSQFDLALDVITDVLQRPAFDEDRLVETQSNALNYIAGRQDDPFTTPLVRAHELVYGEHPYAHDPMGTTKGIERITASHLVKFHTDRYVGGNTNITIVGSFQEKDAVRRLQELLSDYPQGTPDPPIVPPAPMIESDAVRIFKDVDESYIAMGFRAPAAADPDFAAIGVLDALLGLGSGSRLATALGEHGADVSDSHGSFCRCGEEVSGLFIYASTKDPDTALEVIEAELTSLANEPVSDEELDRARNRLVGRVVINGQTNLVRAARLGSYELAGLGFSFGDAYLTAVNRVDKDDILRVASEWLRSPATVVVQPGDTAPPRGRKRAGI
jgi:zinc protease